MKEYFNSAAVSESLSEISGREVNPVELAIVNLMKAVADKAYKKALLMGKRRCRRDRFVYRFPLAVWVFVWVFQKIVCSSKCRNALEGLKNK